MFMLKNFNYKYLYTTHTKIILQSLFSYVIELADLRYKQ